MKRLVLGLALLLVSLWASADPGADLQRLEEAIRDRVICLELVEANVAEGRQQGVTKRLFVALVSDIRDYVELGTDIGIQDLVVIREYVGSDEILVGVFLGAMLSEDTGLRQEQDELRDQGHSQQALERRLWERHGCGDAIPGNGAASG
jgi:hypothetical protein